MPPPFIAPILPRITPSANRPFRGKPGRGGPGACRPEVSCVGPPCSAGGPLFHKAKGAAPFHSIESVDDLISIEDRDEPVHCTRGVMWAWGDVFSEDAPGVLHSSQDRLLIRVVHRTRLTKRGFNARR
jgi:hypothetical protein